MINDDRDWRTQKYQTHPNRKLADATRKVDCGSGCSRRGPREEPKRLV